MKTLLKTLLLCAALAVMSGCSAQKRAERHVRKAVALCPELVQAKAHPIDTALTVPAWADCTTVPLNPVLDGGTLYAPTTHGTVVVSLRKADTVLRVGFVAAPQTIRYRDTVRYAQVASVAPKASSARTRTFWSDFGFVMLGVVTAVICLFALAVCGKRK